MPPDATISGAGIKAEVYTADFGAALKEYARLKKFTLREAIRDQGRLLLRDLINATPPFSGRSLTRMLAARGLTLNARSYVAGQDESAGIANLSARKVGERRVETDIRRVIHGVERLDRAPGAADTATLIVSQTNPRYATHGADLAAGVRQRVAGVEAVRIYADRRGNVYGVDAERFRPDATLADLAETHRKHRLKSGRVTTAGRRDKVVGRWRFLDKLVTKEATVRKYVKRVQDRVGLAKGGWATAFQGLGGRAPGWIARHTRYGRFVPHLDAPDPSFTAVNVAAWAEDPLAQTVVLKAAQTRHRRLQNWIAGALRANARQAGLA
ncbi:MAG: hypothetical protein LDL56_04350 [Armatimonadetes bacterium]|nr:hypothetical protein [Armatimonadota bacterium]